MADFFNNKYNNKFFSSFFRINSKNIFESPLVPPIDNKIIINNQRKDDPRICLRLLFVGSLMTIYDFETIGKSLQYLKKGGFNYELIIAGNGESKSEIESIFEDIGNVYFLGWIDRAKTLELANISHLALAPYLNLKNYELNLSNKYIDYMSLGLPVLSPLKGYPEYLINKYKIGWNYKSTHPKELSSKIIQIIKDPQEIIKRSQNASNLHEEKFNYDFNYNKLVDNLDLIKKN